MRPPPAKSAKILPGKLGLSGGPGSIFTHISEIKMVAGVTHGEDAAESKIVYIMTCETSIFGSRSKYRTQKGRTGHILVWA